MKANLQLYITMLQYIFLPATTLVVVLLLVLNFFQSELITAGMAAFYKKTIQVLAISAVCGMVICTVIGLQQRAQQQDTIILKSAHL